MERFKLIFIVTILCFFVTSAFSQQYTPMTAAGYQMKRIKADSTLHIPSFCGVPTLRNSTAKEGAIAMDTCNNKLYKWTNASGWSEVAGGGGGGTGTVTSVGTGYGLSGGPITTSGTISIDSATLSAKYLKISDTSNKWVSSVTKVDDSTIQVVKDGTTTNINFTTSTNATRLITKVWNSTGTTITRGSVVYINGAHSSVLPSIALAKANAESTSAYTYGLVVDDIADNNEGVVIQNGAITNLNLPTSSYTDGQTLYLSPTIAGGYTTTKPLAPNHYVAIGTITRAHPVFGTIQVAIRNGFQLDEMSDVSISSLPNDSTLLQFSRVDSLWHDVSVTNAIGTKYIKPSDTATMLTNYIDGNGTTGSIAKFTASGSIGNATAGTDYLTPSANEWIINKGYEALGSSIKGVNLVCPNVSTIVTGVTAGLTTGTPRFVAVYIPKAVTITGVKWLQVTAGVYTANNYNGVGLYSYSGGTLTLVASSTDDGTIWKTTSGSWGTKAFSSTYSASAGVYFICAMYNSSAQTTQPLIGATTSSNVAAVNTFDFTNSAKLSATGSATSLPSSQASSGLTAVVVNPGLFLY